MDALPYNLSRLESVSRSEMAIQDTLLHFVPEGETRLKLLLAMEQSLQQCIRGGCTLHPQGYRLADAAPWLHRAGTEGLYVIFSTVPTGAKALLVFDPVLALALINRLLGGELTEVPAERDLSEIEHGVLTYLLMQVCRSFHDFFGNETAPIRVEKVVTRTEDVQNLIAGTEMMAVADVTVAIPELTGQLQLVLPDMFIEEVLAPRTALPDDSVSGDTQEARLMQLGDLVFPMQACVGELSLSPKEIDGLQVGDIVLVDSPYAHVEGATVKGSLKLYPMRPGAPTVETKIREAGPPARPEVIGLYHDA